LTAQACEGFVAVNTSTRLAREVWGEEVGGLSGQPLRETALEVIALLRDMVGPQPLVIGGGGVTEPSNAPRFIDHGADLVQCYTGLIYAGPSFPAECAAAVRDHVRSTRPLPAASGTPL
jgi:dihydroorotate dehydrogenase